MRLWKEARYQESFSYQVFFAIKKVGTAHKQFEFKYSKQKTIDMKRKKNHKVKIKMLYYCF